MCIQALVIWDELALEHHGEGDRSSGVRRTEESRWWNVSQSVRSQESETFKQVSQVEDKIQTTGDMRQSLESACDL